MLQLDRKRTILVPFLALALFAGACKSGNASDKGAATGEDITRAANGIQVGIDQLDAVLTSLTSLVNDPAADLDPQFKTFSKHLDELDSTAKKVRDAAADMEVNGKEYFAAWDKQIAAIQNEDISERTAERRHAVEASLNEIKGDYGKSREAFKVLMSDLKDIHTALGADLTMSGIDAIKKSAKKANSSGEDVKESLQELVDTFREVGVKLSKRNAAAEKAAEKK